jgi:hypothetical protein
VPGQSGTSVTTSLFACSTRRVSIKAFVGIEMSDGARSVVAVIPPDLFISHESVGGSEDEDLVDIC